MSFLNFWKNKVKATGTAYWACRPCTAYAQGINRKVREVEDRVGKLEGTSKETTEGLAAMQARVDKLESALKVAESRIDSQNNAVCDGVFDEVGERAGRRMNVVIHNITTCPNPAASGEERLKWDKDQCLNILTALNTGLTDRDIKFCRRVGAADKGRPVVLGLHTEAARDLLLSKNRDLSKLPQFAEAKVKISTDLTKRQRKEEQKLWDQAKEKNRSLTEEERKKKPAMGGGRREGGTAAKSSELGGRRPPS